MKSIREGMTEGEKRCLKCIYHCILERYVCCEYLLVTGHSQGGVPQLECDKFIKGDNQARIRICADREMDHETLSALFNQKKKLWPSRKPKAEMDNRPELPIRPPVAAPPGAHKSAELDLDAWADLLKLGTPPMISAHTGINLATLKSYRTRKKISTWAAEIVLEVYGVELRKQK